MAKLWTECFATVEAVLRTPGCGRAVVFAPFSGIVDALASALQSAFSSTTTDMGGYSFRALCSTSSETDRIRSIAEFNNGDVNALICTDAQARGLDFVAVDTVIIAGLHARTNNSAAINVDTFVHRAGRTARNNGAGRVVVVHNPARDAAALRQIELVTHVSFLRWYPGCSFIDGVPRDNSSAEANKKNKQREEIKGVTFLLRIKEAFTGKKNSVGNITTAEATLRKVLSAKSISAFEVIEQDTSLSNTADVDDINKSSQVLFTCDLSAAPSIKKALWQYNVKEIDESS